MAKKSKKPALGRGLGALLQAQQADQSAALPDVGILIFNMLFRFRPHVSLPGHMAMCNKLVGDITF